MGDMEQIEKTVNIEHQITDYEESIDVDISKMTEEELSNYMDTLHLKEGVLKFKDEDEEFCLNELTLVEEIKNEIGESSTVEISDEQSSELNLQVNDETAEKIIEIFNNSEMRYNLLMKECNLLPVKNTVKEISEKVVVSNKGESIQFTDGVRNNELIVDVGGVKDSDSIKRVTNKGPLSPALRYVNGKECLRPYFFNKCPGFLHFSFDKLTDCSPVIGNGVGLSLKVVYHNNFLFKKAKTFEKSKLIDESEIVNISMYSKIPVDTYKGDLTGFVFMYRHSCGTIKLAAKGSFKLGEKDFKTLHNNLVEMNIDLARTNTSWSNSLFCGPGTISRRLSIHASYISNDEVHSINAPVSNSLFSLTKWLVVRKFAIYKLFSGYVTIKGDNMDPTGYLWKHRYIRIFGYTIYIFDDRNNNVISSVNIADANPSITMIKENIIGFILPKRGRFEIQCNKKEKLVELKEAVSSLFPKFKQLNLA